MTGDLRSFAMDTKSSVPFTILADSRQREVLSVMLAYSRPMAVDELAVQIAAQTHGESGDHLSADTVRQIQADLHHRYLPKLAALGWVERRPEGVVLTDRIPFADESELSLAISETDSLWDAYVSLVARPRRGHVLSVLSRRRESLGLDALIDELATESATTTSASYGTDSRLPVVLHHVDLPRLDAVDLLTYDSDTKTVTREPALTVFLDQVDLAAFVTDDGSVP